MIDWHFLVCLRPSLSGYSPWRSTRLILRADVGKRLVDLHTTLALVHAAPSPLPAQATDEYGRVPFRHPALGGLQNVTLQAKARMGDKRRMSQLAQQYGLASVVRWKPKKVRLHTCTRFKQEDYTDTIPPFPGQQSNRVGNGSGTGASTLCHCRCGCAAERRGERSHRGPTTDFATLGAFIAFTFHRSSCIIIVGGCA